MTTFLHYKTIKTFSTFKTTTVHPQVLEKIQSQVHDAMCNGPTNHFLNLTKINQSSAKANDSWDSKQGTEYSERIPKINGVNAQIK